jgi:hypothetical protein
MPPEILPLLLVMALPPPPSFASLAEQAEHGHREIPGCHLLVGEVEEWRDGGALGNGVMKARFSGQIEQGRWSELQILEAENSNPSFHIQSNTGSLTFPFIPPIFGLLPAGPQPTDGPTPAAGEPSVGDEVRDLFAEVLAMGASEVAAEFVSEEQWQGREVYRYDRLLAERDPLFGPPQRNMLSVLVDPATLSPRSWIVQVDDPARLRDGPGRFQRLVLTLSLDAQGRPAEERMLIHFKVGPLRFRVDRLLRYSARACS